MGNFFRGAEFIKIMMKVVEEKLWRRDEHRGGLLPKSFVRLRICCWRIMMMVAWQDETQKLKARNFFPQFLVIKFNYHRTWEGNFFAMIYVRASLNCCRYKSIKALDLISFHMRAWEAVIKHLQHRCRLFRYIYRNNSLLIYVINHLEHK